MRISAKNAISAVPYQVSMCLQLLVDLTTSTVLPLVSMKSVTYRKIIIYNAVSIVDCMYSTLVHEGLPS